MGGRSRVAAQLMAGQGFNEVYNLRGGISAWQGLKAIGPAEVGMALVRGDEIPSEIIVLAYGMEEGLRGFYASLTLEVNDREVAAMFAKLADIEVRHKERLFTLYKELDASVSDMETFEARIVGKVMEGGLTTEEEHECNPALISSFSP